MKSPIIWTLVVCTLLAWYGDATSAQFSSSIGTNFTASTRSESGSSPPDTQGEVGPNHVVLLINGRYETYTKNSTGTPISGQASSLGSFWQNRGAGTVTDAFDPRITYDPFSQRWYAVSAANRRSATSGFYLGVSGSADPTGSWSTFLVDADPTNTAWLDFPMLGIDRDTVYVSSNFFTIAGDTFSRSDIVAISKADLVAGTPTVANRQDINSGSIGRPQPASALDNLGPSTGNSMAFFRAGNLSVSRNVLNGNEVGQFTLGNSQSTTLNSFSAPTGGRQPNGTIQTIDVTNAFMERMVRINGSYWGVQTVKSGSDDVLRWFELNAVTFAKKQEGTISIANRDLYYSSIAVNEDGDVVIGFSASGPDMNPSGSSPNGFIGAYAAVGKTSSGTTSFNSPILLQAGTGNYNNVFGGRNRWGDYSATRVDPADPNIFWTWQEWAGNASATDWRVQISELITRDDNEFYWSDDVNGTYASAAGWINGSAPTSGDHVIFSRPGNAYSMAFGAGTTVQDRIDVRQGSVTLSLDNHTLDLTNANASTPSLAVSPYQGTSILTLDGVNGVLHTRNTTIAAGLGGVGTVQVLGNNFAWTNDGFLQIGSITPGEGGSGTLVVGTSASVTTGTLQIAPGAVVTINTGGSLDATHIDNRGSLAKAVLDVEAGQSFSGAGTFIGNLNLEDGSRVAPGNSPGVMTIEGDVTWGNITYDLEFASAVGTAGMSWDLIDIVTFGGAPGILTIDPGAVVTINLDTYPANISLPSFNSSLPWSWTIVETDGGIFGFGGATFLFDLGGFTPQNSLGNGGFFVDASANSLFLKFDPNLTAVPEPGSVTLTIVAALGGTWRWRRKRAGAKRTSEPAVV